MQSFVKLAATWPAAASWRGFTLGIADGLYAAWLIAATLLPLFMWVCLGALFVLLLLARGLVLQTKWQDESESQKDVDDLDWRTRYDPIAYFFHRNHTLHVMAVLAFISADGIGAFLMLGVGALVDCAREINVRRWSATQATLPYAMDHETGGFGKDPLVQLLLTTALCFSILTWLWSIDMKGNLFFELLDQLTIPFAHFQRSIIDSSRLLENSGAFDDAIRFRLTEAVCVVILLYFCSVHQTSIIKFALRRPTKQYFLVAPLSLAMMSFLFAAGAHVALTFDEPYRNGGFGAGLIFSFSRYDALFVLLCNLLSVYSTMGLLVALTKLRAVEPPLMAFQTRAQS